ncbi:MAG: alpha-amylase family glycosyl hydrolase [bacterium]|nr:alpha-amylase family glycosyl hydrolase [bacterium]
MQSDKPIIYQLFPRLYTNTCENCVANGDITTNGVGKMNEIDDVVLASIKKLGITHVWYTGVIEHAQATTYPGITPDNHHVVKGKAGSPYAIKDYYDIDPDIAVDVDNRLGEFRSLVERTHRAGMKVIIDFVPNHVARHYHSDAKPAGVTDFGDGDDSSQVFSPDNNFYYIQEPFAPYIDLGEGDDRYSEQPAKATGNDCFSAHPNCNDWYETVKLNYGINYANHTWHFSPIPDTWQKMLHIIEYWIEQGVDGFRCDMAFMVPVQFWNWMIPQVKEKHPDVIFIAEIYDCHIYRQYLFDGHFDYLYDKVNLYDTVRGITCGFASAALITHCWHVTEGISHRMLNFLENHDEQRIASPQFAGDAFKGIPALILSATISTGPYMIYAGQELGEKAADAEGFSGMDGRTTIFDYWSVPSLRRWYNGGACNGKKSTKEEKELRKIYAKVLNMCNKEKAISQGGFFDLMYVNYENLDASRQFAYLRHHGNEVLLAVVNFADEPAKVKITIPEHALSCTPLTEGTYQAKELIHNAKGIFKIKAGTPFDINIPANDAVIWKFTIKAQ